MDTLMRRYWTRGRAALAAGLVLCAAAMLFAQEPQIFSRGINVIQGNVTVSRGSVFSGAGVIRDYRTASTVTGGAATYTAAQVLTGIIARGSVGADVTDAMPTAANLAAAIPGVIPGLSFTTLVDMGATPSGTTTLNGASTGVTYANGCATAIGTGDEMLLLINFTSASAYTVYCLNVNT